MKKSVGDILKLFFSIGIGVLIVWLTTRKLTAEQINSVKNVFSEANYFWVILGPLVGMLSNVVRAERWRMLLNSAGFQPKRSNVIYAVFVMYAGNLLFPRLGEVTRCSFLYKTDGVAIDKSIGTMMLERVIDLITMLLMGLLVFAVEYKVLYTFFAETLGQTFSAKLANISVGQFILFVVGAIVFVGLFFFLIYKNREQKYVAIFWNIFKGIIDGVLSIGKLKQPVLFVFYSILIWVMYWYMFYLCYGALAATEGLSGMSAVACVFFGGFAFIVSQGGIGAYPATIAAVLLLYKIPYEIGFAFGWLVWTLQTAAVIFCGVIAFMLISRNFSFTKKVVADE